MPLTAAPGPLLRARSLLRSVLFAVIQPSLGSVTSSSCTSTLMDSVALYVAHLDTRASGPFSA
jgi:hypothetical protein